MGYWCFMLQTYGPRRRQVSRVLSPGILGTIEKSRIVSTGSRLLTFRVRGLRHSKCVDTSSGHIPNTMLSHAEAMATSETEVYRTRKKTSRSASVWGSVGYSSRPWCYFEVAPYRPEARGHSAQRTAARPRRVGSKRQVSRRVRGGIVLCAVERSYCYTKKKSCVPQPRQGDVQVWGYGDLSSTILTPEHFPQASGFSGLRV